MAASTVYISGNMTTDVSFRAWATALSNIIATYWVQTADTGQINLTTATRPLSINTSAGYQIFRMNDSLQATTPCYLKIEYGCGSTATTFPAIWMSIGNGTDGAGTLTLLNGGNAVRFEFNGNATPVASFNSYFSIDTNRLCFYLNLAATASLFLYSVERTHDTSGADTSAGLMVFTNLFNSPGSNLVNSFVILSGIKTTTYTTSWNATLSATVDTQAFSTNVYTNPVRTWGLGESSPSLCWTMYYTQNLTTNNAIPITLWDGNSHTVMPLGPPPNICSYGAATLTTTSVAMRYE